MTCHVCGTVAVPGARFCHNCGTPLLGTAAPPAAERRVVTVLFGDLSDFTAWAEDLDPERVGAVTDRVLAALAGAVKTFGGHVDKLTGDGIMAVFGAPVAHEDDAERAIRAALSMQRAVRRVLDDERGGGAPVGLRVGLNTGEVIAGVQAGLEYTVIGDAVNTAARLADAAAVGTVYAGERTASATRRIASWRQLRPLRLKGKRAPVESYELLGMLDAPGTRAGMGDEAPFVGRETELAWVASRLAEVDDRGEPRVLLLTAEAGLGKTRFAGQVERLAAAYDVNSPRFAAGVRTRVLAVQCAAYGERRRLTPLTDLVRVAIGVPTDGPPVTRAVVEDRLTRLATRFGWPGSGPSRPTLDLLATAIAGPDGEPPDGPLMAVQTPWSAATGNEAVDYEAIPSAVAAVLSGLARESPVLVIVDDLHDATPETMDALGRTLTKLEGAILVLLLGRPELVRTAGALTRLSEAEVATLPALRGADAARLLATYLGEGRLPQADADRLLATAQGNPFYLAELVTLLMERGAMTTTAGPPGWRLAAGSLGGRLLSRDLAAVLAARIDALPADARATLRDAVVVGDTVPAGALEALRDRRGNGSDRPAAARAVELERAVEELLTRRMLRRVRGGYAFVTPLLREAAYAGIGKADLADRHAHLARWAASAPAPDRMTAPAADAFIADHVERAATLADSVGLRPGAPARDVTQLGVAALSRTARRAINSGEPAQAARSAERAAALTSDTLPLPDRLVYARALLQLGRPKDALVQAEKLAADAAGDDYHRASAQLLAGRAYRLLGDGVKAVAHWEEALAVATAAGFPNVRAEAMRRLGMADFLAGRLAEAGSMLTQAYQVALAADDPRSQAWSLQNLAWVATTRGDFAGADAILAVAARLFAQQRDPVGRAWLRGTTAFARLLATRLGEARRLARVFLPFGERVGDQWATATLRAVEAYAAAELGDLAEADRSARRAYGEFAATSDDWGRGFALVVRGTVARGLAEADHALDLLSEALEYGDRIGHPLLIGMARTIRGFVQLDRGEPGAAEADARVVLNMVAPHNVFESAAVGSRVLLGAARLATGDVEAALAQLEPVAAAAEEPSMLLPRRLAVAAYAAALIAAGRVDEAVDWADRAALAPGEDIRSATTTARIRARALAAVGSLDAARAAAAEAVASAYATEQRSERAACDALLAELEAGRPAPAG
ncbi:MAG TPA: adenylate/guanylate cyclase domain-containing protein [Micromonosporaceae bacterium]|nr:adenylate/guanylate cyclase domain-containing protein [Micromonosporaceae bacterium]